MCVAQWWRVDDDYTHYVTLKSKQAPAVAVETETFPIDHSSHEDSKRDDSSTQVFTVRGSSLVDYSESYETNEDCTKDQPLTPHCDEVGRKKRRTENILMNRASDFSDPLHNSHASIVDQTDDEDSVKDHSSVQSDDEVVPRLRRTKSILFSDALCDSSDDSTKGPSTSMSEMASQRLRRSCSHPVSLFLPPSCHHLKDSTSQTQHHVH
ncbi:uncharacterized protein LOC121905123 [Thunnus maccoyii]|uniref:uncharacterized protein LOC121905123 n=1 Tax=Thunnus maccoyii TaxID=8240 RepID=UPI001C4DB833|nr:uncharacterized protein LOC121905123 [Thunnus maccoyii]